MEGLFAGVGGPLKRSALVVVGEAGLFSEVIGLMKSAVLVGGSLWLLWGAIVLAGGLKDKNGPQLQSGIWQIVGGAVIIAAGILFTNLDLF